MTVKYYQSKKELVKHLTEFTVDNLKLKHPNYEYNIVLTGGSSSSEIADSLVKTLNIKSVRNLLGDSEFHFWLTDERYAPKNSRFRNDMLIEKSLTNLSEIYFSVFHPMILKEDIGTLALRELHERELEKTLGSNYFDVVILSLSKDGHIASIFDHRQKSVNETHRVEVTTSPSDDSPNRLSLSLISLSQTNLLIILAYVENPKESKLKFFKDDSSLIRNLIQRVNSNKPNIPVVVFTNETMEL